MLPGRDWYVESAVSGTRYKNRRWKAEVEWRTDLLEEGNNGMSCTVSLAVLSVLKLLAKPVGVNHGIPQDGRVAVLTVTSFSL